MAGIGRDDRDFLAGLEQEKEALKRRIEALEARVKQLVRLKLVPPARRNRSYA